MDDTLNGFRQFKIDNIHNEKETNHTASTLYGYINMPMVNTIYGYQDIELNHMVFGNDQELSVSLSVSLRPKVDYS